MEENSENVLLIFLKPFLNYETKMSRDANTAMNNGYDILSRSTSELIVKSQSVITNFSNKTSSDRFNLSKSAIDEVTTKINNNTIDLINKSEGGVSEAIYFYE